MDHYEKENKQELNEAVETDIEVQEAEEIGAAEAPEAEQAAEPQPEPSAEKTAEPQPEPEPSAEQARPYVQYYTGPTPDPKAPPKKKLPTWAKALIIIGIVIVCIALLTTGCNRILDSMTVDLLGSTTHSSEVTTDFGHDYIGVLHVEGTITDGVNGTYDQEYILNSIDAMMEDDDNKGMILFVDTPGGSVFASDEVYFKIKEYQETTGRPVYSSMQNQATSGGYYISAPADKIIANRNCWTGSIGVIVGTIYDVSELLDKLGVEAIDFVSAENKAMGSGMKPMTEEQKAIYQGLVDEAYQQFVEIVMEGRDMDEATVKKLADGRVYTAKQALENGLIDQIGTYEEAIEDMKKEYGLEDCEVETFESYVSDDIFSLLGYSAEAGSGVVTADVIEDLIALNSKVTINYMCELQK